ncbi:MAG: hypothetical protein ACXABV_10695 [Candidatus Thorarchaeota archaeon]|jgi:hypothetical protein
MKTISVEDVAVWSIVAPPNDAKKRKTLENWMKSHTSLVIAARQKMAFSKKQVLLLRTKSGLGDESDN